MAKKVVFKTPKQNKIKMRGGDLIFYGFSSFVLIALIIIIGYPVLYTISCSFSSGRALLSGRVLLWPVEPSLSGYQLVFKYKAVWVGFKNSIIYTIISVAVTMFLQILTAYPLSRRNFQARKPLTTFFFIPMLVSAGMIPTYITRSKLGLVGNPGGVILAGCLGFSNVLILRTAFKGVPEELYEAARVDGANDIQVMLRIALPLIKATTSVMILYSIVGCWNDYFNPMLYLRKAEQFPLQLVLRTILTGVQQVDKS